MSRISVVVPVYNVKPYLAECLDSIAGQTFEDLEVVLVEDGSTDGSAEIAQEYVDRDPRFRLVSQPNGGLGRARNTGADAATGEFLAFVDSDDVLPLYAYEMLLKSLDETGSDFATGNVHRLTRLGTTQSPFLADTFKRTRPATHVTKFRALIADRIVPNKLWRRSFWESHGYRFPEGVLHEDISVVVPAQFAARSVDVIAEPVYHYRIRAGEDLSITQRRLEQRALRDRMTAIEHVSEHLAREGPRNSKRWYDASVLGDDLRYYIDVLDGADEDYRALFLERVNAFLDRADDRIYDELPAIQRLKWHLVRKRAMPELLEVLRFQKEDLNTTAAVESGGHWYGDYPFRNDPRLAIPASVYKLGPELWARAQLDGFHLDDGMLVVEGYAYIDGIGAGAPETQTVTLSAVRRGRFQRLRRRISGIRLKTESPLHRPDATAAARQQRYDLAWAGFVATLDPRALRRLGRLQENAWELNVTVRAGKVKRRSTRFVASGLRPQKPVTLPAPDGMLARAFTTGPGSILIEARRHPVTASGFRVDGDALEVSGTADGLHGEPKLEVVPRGSETGKRYPLTLDAAAGTFTARVPLAGLRAPARVRADDEGDNDDRAFWTLLVANGGAERAPVVYGDVPERRAIRIGERDLIMFRTGRGDAAVGIQSPRLVATEADWTPDGELDLAGLVPADIPDQELVIGARRHEELHAFALQTGADGGFRVRLTPAHLESLAGALPLREGMWDLYSRPAGARPDAPLAPLMLGPELHERLPVETVVAHKPFALGMRADNRAQLQVERDLDQDERGSYNQRRLRETVYASAREQPLEDIVVYASFGGRQYSDSPRAIYEELLRRDAPVEHLWVVRDGMCQVPAPARVIREGSREHHDVLARARFVVTNDHFPDWFRRRDEQVCVQTWHGTPLKRLGLDVSEMRKSIRRFQHRWDQQIANWQYVVSPNRFSTPILRQAYAIGGEMLETGYPRNDVLAHPDRDRMSEQIRRKLGLPEGKRVVLYAPTYRDHVVDKRGRYRLDLHLDLDRLRAAVGPDTVILFRKHHYVADAVPAGPDGFVHDVSSYPDATELLLAADVLVTDYSSLMFDFANTGRPMLFFTYDLDSYRDEIRGFYLDYVDTIPGPLLRTTDEVAEALRDIEGTAAAYSERYREFAARFCSLDDGRAAARVVDRVFPW